MTKELTILRDLLEAFPPLDPASEFHDTGVDGAELTAYLSNLGPEIRALLDASKPEKIETVHCPDCGSDNIVVDASARWDVALQDYVISSTYDEWYCCDCERETKFPTWKEQANA